MRLENDKPVGTAQLKFHELVAVAIRLGVTELHLQTQDMTGGLYRRLGWQAMECVNYKGIDVLVMERKLR